MEARVFLDEPFELSDDRSLWASGHFGVVASLRLAPQPGPADLAPSLPAIGCVRRGLTIDELSV